MRLAQVLLVLAGALAGLSLALAVSAIQRELAQPLTLHPVGYAQSTECVLCHQNHYRTWHQTYHRRMTQPASPDTVLGDFDNATYTYQGVTSRFNRTANGYTITTLGIEGRLTTYTIALTVGSRRIQQYVAQVNDRHLRVPLAWNIEEGRWFHLNGGFLDPDDADFNTHLALWDANCIFCHNVRARPGYDFAAQTFDAQVAEFGIACEACHGPASEHIARNANPLRRYLLYASGRDPSIISPRELTPLAQAQICGQCHGQRLPNPLDRIEEFVTTGWPFIPGDDLNAYTTPLTPQSLVPNVDVPARFWGDGTPRLTAYEYQGYLLSTGHLTSELTCSSCHTMHGGDPKGMIEPALRGNQGCTQCHAAIAADVSAHTRHAPDSPGSECYACHMPHITYGVLTLHRTHRIQNPDPARAWRYAMPEACTLCHTNQTAVWSARQTSALFGAPLPADLPAADPTYATAETIRALFSGDVVQRATAAYALGQGRYTSDTAWHIPLALRAMQDRYPVIRRIAYLSLLTVARNLPGVDALPAFDYLAEPAERARVLAAWETWWRALDKRHFTHPGPAVPLTADFLPDEARLQALLALQNNTVVSIGE